MHLRTIAAAGTLVLVATIGSPAVASATEATTPGQIAVFEGRTFDMSQGWGRAKACDVTETGAVCYRSEAEMNAAVNVAADASALLASSCASPLRLYDGTSQTGSVLSLSTRGTVLSLSTYGFDNRTSSYRVGACSSIFYSGFGTGVYGGNTAAYASASSMLSGWNNVVSSVFIN